MDPSPQNSSIFNKIAVGSATLTIIYIFGVKWLLNSTLAINWDEFHFAGLVFDVWRGREHFGFLTFHSALFFWMPFLDLNEVDQILLQRHLAFAFRILTSILIYRLISKTYGRNSGLAAVLITLSFSFVLKHGEAFRYDYLVANLFLCGLYLLVEPKFKFGVSLFVSTLLFLIAFLISPKSLIFLPAFGAALSLRAQVNVPVFKTVIFATGAGVLATSAFMLTPTWSQLFSDFIFSKLFTFPNFAYTQQSLAWDYDFWFFFSAGTFLCLVALASTDERRKQQGVLGLALAIPMLTLTSYRDSFGYFFVTLVPLAAITAAVPFSFLDRINIKLSALALMVLAIFSAGKTHRFYGYNSADEIADQRIVINEFYRLFPGQTTYIDKCSMFFRNLKEGVFMVSYESGVYRKESRSIMPGIVAKARPTVVVSNTRSLRLDLNHEPRMSDHLLKEDLSYLSQNYQHFWGPFFVPGFKVSLNPGQSEEIDVVFQGDYWLRSNGELAIDKNTVSAGAKVNLSKGKHTILNRGDSPVWARLISRSDQDLDSSNLLGPVTVPMGTLYFKNGIAK